MRHRAEIDGLRALAVLPVLLFHADFAMFGGGFVGVDVFFVISGYLITTIIVNERLAGRYSLRHFYARRIRRILPALIVVVLCSVPFAWFLMRPDQLNDFAQSVVASSFMASNILFYIESGYFDLAANQKPLLHTWSLAVEEQYYLIYPLFLAVLWRWRARETSAFDEHRPLAPLGAWLLVVLIASLLLAEWGWRHEPAGNFYLMPTRMWELLIGALVALTMIDARSLASTGRAGWLAMIGLAMLVYAIFAFDENVPFPSLYALIPTLGTALIIRFAGPGNLTGRLLSVQWLTGVGLISYSLYLWHQPVLVFTRTYLPEDPTTWQLWLALGVCFPLAWLSWRFVEAPFRSRRTLTTPAVLLLTGFGTVLSAGLGVMILKGGHLPALYDELGLVTATQSRQYNLARHRQLPRNFDDATVEQRKVLLLGDSYAADFVNFFAEAGEFVDDAVAARYITTDCQTYFGEDDVTRFRGLKSSAWCDRDIDEADVIALAHKADLVLLVSRWEPWAAERVDETLRHLGDEDTRVVVFGRKHFYLPDRRQIEAGVGIQATPKVVRATNRILDDRVPDSRFIDLQRVGCGKTWRRCPVFTRNGQLIASDQDGHQTKAGARFLGKRLFADSEVRRKLALP